MDFDKLDERNIGIEGLIGEMRALRGALNARAFSDESSLHPVLVEIATLKTQVQHLQTSIRELRTALWGLAAGVLAMVIKIVVEGGLLK